MEGLAIDMWRYIKFTIKGISEDGVTQAVKVYPNLVSSTGKGLGLNQCKVIQTCY
jgi:hypothetical protein